MTYITEELKEDFKDYLAEQSYIYDDNKQGLTHSYYWDYRDIIEPWLMEKLIKDYGDYSTIKDALHQYALENDMFDYEENRQRNTTIAFMESLGIKYTDATEDFLEELLDLFYDIFNPKDSQVFYETEERTFEPTTYETVKDRFEATVNNYEFLGILNWFYDDTKSDNILPSILKELESENSWLISKQSPTNIV